MTRGTQRYIIGDSHCLPPAWHVVNVHGELRTIHPLLVTGLKAWHMRPEVQFVTTSNLTAVLEYAFNVRVCARSPVSCNTISAH